MSGQTRTVDYECDFTDTEQYQYNNKAHKINKLLLPNIVQNAFKCLSFFDVFF